MNETIPSLLTFIIKEQGEIAEKRGVPRIHIAFAWLLQKEPVTVLRKCHTLKMP